MYPMQSDRVMALNASCTMRLGVGVDVYTLSFAFNVALTFENTSSNGIKSGLYGGRNTNRAPTPVMMS